jgi:hypothetical protein
MNGDYEYVTESGANGRAGAEDLQDEDDGNCRHNGRHHEHEDEECEIDYEDEDDAENMGDFPEDLDCDGDDEPSW